MRKLDFERMQRLEEIVDRQKKQIDSLEKTIDLQTITVTKLTGANDALKEVLTILRGPVVPPKLGPIELDVTALKEAQRLTKRGHRIAAMRQLRTAFSGITLSLLACRDIVKTWESQI